MSDTCEKCGVKLKRHRKTNLCWACIIKQRRKDEPYFGYSRNVVLENFKARPKKGKGYNFRAKAQKRLRLLKWKNRALGATVNVQR